MKTLFVLGVFLVALTLFNTVITYRLIKSIDAIWDQFRQLRGQLSVMVSDIIDELQRNCIKEDPAQSTLTSAEYWKKVEDGSYYLDSTLFKFLRYNLKRDEIVGLFESFLNNDYAENIEEQLVYYIQYLSRVNYSKIKAELIADIDRRIGLLKYPDLKVYKKLVRCSEYRGGKQCINQNFFNNSVDCFSKEEFLFLLEEYKKLPDGDKSKRVFKELLSESRFCINYSFYGIERTLVEEFKDPEDNFLYHLLCDNK